MTENTVLVPITLQIKNRDITFVTKNGVSKGVVNILGKVTTLTHKTVQTFEDTVEVEQPAELLEKSLDKKSIYWKALPAAARALPPGYCHQGREQPGSCRHLRPRHRCADLSRRKAGHLIADSGRPDEPGGFALDRRRQLRDRQHKDLPAGDPELRPLRSTSSATSSSNFWMQVYNLGIDEASKSNLGHGYLPDHGYQHEYGGLREAVGIKGLGSAQRSVDRGENRFPWPVLQPGKYKVTIKINDDNFKTRDCAIGAFCRGIVCNVPRNQGLPGFRSGTRAGMRICRSDLPGTPPGHTVSVIMRRLHLALFVGTDQPGERRLSVVRPQRSVSGVVRDSAGVPQIGAVVQLLRPDMSRGGHVSIPTARATSHFATVLPGHYAVKAMGASFPAVACARMCGFAPTPSST